MSRIFEILAFAVSVAAFCYSIVFLFQAGVSKYFKLYACAIGCYMLEELWVIVNLLLASGGQSGLVTIRLIGFFGCLCFMLSANANAFDSLVDDKDRRRPQILALAAPAVLIVLYGFYAFSLACTDSSAALIIGFASISPALFASYFSFKHLLLPSDAMGFLEITKKIDILALVFYLANYAYPAASLYLPQNVMSVCDLILAGMLFLMAILCRKGASKWKTLIC